MKNIEIYKEVWQVMDACNSSGVIHFLSNKVTPAIWEEIHNKEFNGEFNKHPLIIIILDKLMQLAGCYLFDSKDHAIVSKAYCDVLDAINNKQAAPYPNLRSAQGDIRRAIEAE